MLVLLLFALGCPSQGPKAPVEPPPPTKITIVAMNDFHGALYERPLPNTPDRYTGGLPWVAAAVEELRREDPDLLLLDGGDAFQGDWPVNATRGKGAIRALDLLGVTAQAVGNHEFDYGAGEPGSHPLRGAFEEAAAMSQHPLLTANVHLKPKGNEYSQPWTPKGVQPFAVVERKGVKIGLIGLTTTQTPTVTNPVNVEDLMFLDPVQAVKDALPWVQGAGAKVIVVVGHLTGGCQPKGWLEPDPACRPDGEIGRLLTELPRGTIDVIVAGHAHTLLANRVDDTFVLEGRSHGQILNRVELMVGPDGVAADPSVLHPPWGLVHDKVDPGCDAGGVYPIEPRDLGGRVITPSRPALDLVKALEKEAGPPLCEQLTCAAKTFGRDREAASELGNLVADAMLAAFPEAQIALQNSGGLRADLPEGDVLRMDIHAVMPFDNKVVLVEMTGEQLLLALRIGSSGAHGVLQVAGMHYVYDPSRTVAKDVNLDGQLAEWERDRLCSANVGDVAVDKKATYKVVTSDFLFNGGDHLGPAFKNAKLLAEGPLLREVIETHVATFGEACLGAPPEPPPEEAKPKKAPKPPPPPRVAKGACAPR